MLCGTFAKQLLTHFKSYVVFFCCFQIKSKVLEYFTMHGLELNCLVMVGNFIYCYEREESPGQKCSMFYLSILYLLNG